MKYQSILNRIEEQNKDRNLSAKVFRYAGLIKAIEFFSQKLNFEQIIEAAFDFTNELLTLQKSAIFIRQGNNYVLKKLKGYGNEIISIKNSNDLQNLAKFNGGLLYEEDQLLKFFSKSIMDSYGVTVAIPLIIEDSLYGFILISSKAIGVLDSDDYIISEALMKLFNTALENYNRYEELQNMNKELDEKIFNLFAINQSSKALLSELNLNVLYNLSVDVFSELTQSAITGFVLFDEKSEKYGLKAFKDIFNRDSDIDIKLTFNKSVRIDQNRIILNISDNNDSDYFLSIFDKASETLKMLRSEYIILLLKNQNILGFVSLGPTTTNMEYKKGIFELTESLASSAYIALSNSQYFQRVNEQKKTIEEKLQRLISLNKLTKTINSSINSNILIELTLKTLEISFDIEKAIIATYNKEEGSFYIDGALNIESGNRVIKINSKWKRVFEGDMVFEAAENGASQYIDEQLCKDIGACSGILIVPIYIDKADIEVLGTIIIFKCKKVLINDEENMLTMETIAGHIAPVLNSLSLVEEQKKSMQPNYIETFKKDLKKEISDAENYMMHLEIIYIENESNNCIFEENEIIEELRKDFKRVYPFSNDKIFIIENEKEDNIKKIKQLKGIGDMRIRVFKMGRDFYNYEQFFKSFSD